MVGRSVGDQPDDGTVSGAVGSVGRSVGRLVGLSVFKFCDPCKPFFDFSTCFVYPMNFHVSHGSKLGLELATSGGSKHRKSRIQHQER